ncbi:hypothetical protein HEP87_62380 [Streptomyces sp. S1D4-11]
MGEIALGDVHRCVVGPGAQARVGDPAGEGVGVREPLQGVACRLPSVATKFRQGRPPMKGNGEAGSGTAAGAEGMVRV